MRKLLCAMLILALLAVPVFAVSVFAESAVDEDAILSDLIPSSVDGNFEAKDCEVVINKDGSMTITVTGAEPTLNIKLADGTTLYTGSSIDLSDTASNPVYMAVDFGTAGNIQFEHMILHYTRKDKTAAGTFADLYLNSMAGDDNYKDYRKQNSDPGYTAGTALTNGGSYYVVWDWGTYVASSDAKLNDDKHHQFVDMVINLTGSTVGSQVTFYTIAVVSDPDVELGTVKPDPITSEPEESTDEPEESTDEPEESTDESVDEPEESSVEEPSDEPSEEESSVADTSSTTATSSTATSSTPTSSTDSTVSEEDNGGLGTGAIIGIIAAIVVVIGAVVAVVIVKKKK